MYNVVMAIHKKKANKESSTRVAVLLQETIEELCDQKTQEKILMPIKDI